jgi:hypothetical protein
MDLAAHMRSHIRVTEIAPVVEAPRPERSSLQVE